MWGLLEYPFLGLSRLLEVCHNTESNGFDSLSPMKMARFPERQCREGWLGFENVYCNLGPPLTPCGEDRQFVEHALSMWVASHPAERLQALLLGVTPLLARISWPPKSFLAAIDLSRAMVESVCRATFLVCERPFRPTGWRSRCGTRLSTWRWATGPRSLCAIRRATGHWPVVSARS